MTAVSATPGPRSAVLLMAYGTPTSIDDVEQYYTHIRGGRRPSAEQLGNLVSKYKAIGGKTPLLEITRQIAALLEVRLNTRGAGGRRVYIGMKHWNPFIEEAVSDMKLDGIDECVAIAMAPHYSKMSTESYINSVETSAAKIGCGIRFSYIKSWWSHHLYVSAVARRIRKLLACGGPAPVVLFTAHSLPARIISEGDPYQQELMSSCSAVAGELGLERWEFAYQSAGRTDERWLGPGVLETIARLAAEGLRKIIVCPIGFVTDHLEILYDIDIEARQVASRLGVELVRAESLNAAPDFVEALADIVTAGFSEPRPLTP